LDCDRCGKCCARTSMQLSHQDIKRLERIGYRSKNFATTRKGIRTLKNVDGVCFFFNTKCSGCKVYENRPEGCRYYPIAYCLEEGKPIIDEEVCSKAYTVTKEEMNRIAPKLTELVRRIMEDSHTETRKAGKQK